MPFSEWGSPRPGHESSTPQNLVAANTRTDCPIREKAPATSSAFIALEHLVRGALLCPIFGEKQGMHYIIDCIDGTCIYASITLFDFIGEVAPPSTSAKVSQGSMVS